MISSKVLNLTILKKLQLLALAIVLIFVFAMLMMQSANNTTAEKFTEFNEQDFNVFLGFGKVKELQVDTMLNIRGLQISYLLNLTDQTTGYLSTIEANRSQTPNVVKQLKSVVSSENMTKLNQLETLVSDFNDKSEKFVAAMNSAADHKAPFPVFKAFIDSYTELTKFFNDFERHLNASAKQTQQDINEVIASAETVFYVGIILALIISLALSQYIARGISRRIQKLKAASLKLAEGDLVVKVDINSNDELRELSNAINATIDKLRATISTINQSSVLVSKNSDDVMQCNIEVKVGADQITDNTNQAASAIEEMSITSQSIAENITNTATSAEQINQVAAESLTASNESVKEIETLLVSFAETITTVDNLKSQTDSINKILDVIKAIAEQTNLLALNAAIEAARAGEQGRGFAVVADEVRELAQRSHNSVNEIESMLTNLINAGDSASEQMKQSNVIANNLNKRIETSNDLMSDIQEKISFVNQQSQEIASAAEEQSVVVLEVSNNMHTIKTAIERNADIINDSNVKSEEMKQSVNQVNEQLLTFKLK